MSEISSYPKLYNLGHFALDNLLTNGDVVIQEKIDGSQISFQRVGNTLLLRSKNRMIDLDDPGMFKEARDSLLARLHMLEEGIIYRGEYLQKPKHNTLTYDRIPQGHIVLYDIEHTQRDQLFFGPVYVQDTASSLFLESCPVYHVGPMPSYETLEQYLTYPSTLGGMVEGISIKNYNQFGTDGKVVMGKLVAPMFKEKHHASETYKNPSQGTIIEFLVTRYRTEARWNKARQHLWEQGELERSPRDIGKLVKEIPNDIKAEEEEEIKQFLFDWAWPQMVRQLNNGVADWYKSELAKSQS